MEAVPYVSAGVVVHYVTTGLDAPPLNDDNGNGVPDYVEEAGAAADTAFAYYAARGFRAPLADGARPEHAAGHLHQALPQPRSVRADLRPVPGHRAAAS